MDPAGAQCVGRITETDTAAALGSGDVPVLATPRIVAVCEAAACDAVASQLEDGTTTVGTSTVSDDGTTFTQGEMA